MMILDYEQAQNSLLKLVTETDFMPRVKKYQHHVNKVLSDVAAKYEMKLIPSMKAYLMVLNNALGNTVDSATAKLHTDTDGLIDEVEYLRNLGVTPMEDDGLVNDNVLVEAAEKYNAMGTVPHLVYDNVESRDTITDMGSELVSCTYYVMTGMSFMNISRCS